MKNILIVILLIISSFLIFYKYDQIPKGLNHDETELARVAFSLENKPYTPFTPVADGHGTPYFYSLLLSFKIFGANQFALRLPSRIFGILNILLFYLILLKVFIKKTFREYSISFILSLVLLTSHWYLNFVRFSFEMPFLLFLELTSIYFLFNFLNRKEITYLVLSGIFSGLAFNSYQPGRIFFLVPLIMLILTKIKLKQSLSFLIPFIIFILPIGIYLFSHPGNDIRIDQQFFLKNTELSWQKKANFLADNIQKTSLMFIIKGDVNAHHNYPNKPALNPILGLMFLSGLVLVIINYKNRINQFFLIYFVIALVPAILTYPWENPNMLRTYTTLPAIIYFVGQSILFIISLFKRRKFLYSFISLFLLISISISSFYELRTYFKFQALAFKQAFDKPDYLKVIQESAQKEK